MAAGPRDKAGQALEARDRQMAECWREAVVAFREWQKTDSDREVDVLFQQRIESLILLFGDPTVEVPLYGTLTYSRVKQ